MEAIKLCRLDTPIIFIEARINLSRFVVTGCAAKTSATRSEERFSRNAETDLVCRLLLEKKKKHRNSRSALYYCILNSQSYIRLKNLSAVCPRSSTLHMRQNC